MNGGFASVLYVVGTAGLDMSVCEEFVSKLVADAAEQMADGRLFPKAAAKGSFKKSVAIKDCH
ncbi:MAG: hypothetical protein OIF58_09740 [Cohaesibacter sp.]|nr:hypothetical protein [Cohaesibacter sp.]